MPSSVSLPSPTAIVSPSRSTPSPSAGLSIHVTPLRIRSGGTLTVQVVTAPRAHVDVTVSMRTTRTASHVVVKHGQRLRARASGGAVLYTLTVRGMTGPRGRFTAHLRILYQPATPITARVLVTVRTSGGNLRGAGQVAILPEASVSGHGCVLPCALPVGADPVALALDARTGRAFVVNRGGNSVSVLDAATDTLLRIVPVGRQPNAIAVDEGTGLVFVANGGGHTVSVLDAASGAFRRAVAVGANPYALTVGMTARRVFVISNVLDAASGRLLRTAAIGSDLNALTVDEAAGHVFVTDQFGNSVVTLAAASASRLHATRVGNIPWTVAADPRTGRAFLGWGNDQVSTLDAASGVILRTVTVGQAPKVLAVDAATNRVFAAASTDGIVGVLDATTGRLLRTVSVGQAPVALAVDERRGRVYVVDNGRDRVTVLDAASGAVRRVVPAGIGPIAVAVDPRAGKIFVLDKGPTSGRHGAITILSAL